jgi:hypothetical protein
LLRGFAGTDGTKVQQISKPAKYFPKNFSIRDKSTRSVFGKLPENGMLETRCAGKRHLSVKLENVKSYFEILPFSEQGN